MKKTYLQNLEDTLIEGSAKALRYRGQGYGKAWDNRKGRINRTCRPRGKAILKVWDNEWKAMFKRTEAFLKGIKSDAGKYLIE